MINMAEARTDKKFLCRLADLPENTTRGFLVSIGTGDEIGDETGEESGNKKDRLDLILWHQGGGIRAFKNSCPHLHMPLETFPDRFLNSSGEGLICSTHGAQFDKNGKCFSGPCLGRSLQELAIEIDDGNIMLA
jgi:nitrite reductase/ring-hydroxylating ferredoxin subunit